MTIKMSVRQKTWQSWLIALCSSFSGLAFSAPSLDHPYWTEKTTDGRLESQAQCVEGGVVTGLSCWGKRCDDVAVLCDTSVTPTGDERWTDFFTDSDDNRSRICKQDELVTGFRCEGDYCDNVQVKCSKVSNFKRNHCEWSEVDIESGPFDTDRRYWAPEGYVVAGLSCKGDHCAKMNAYLCSENGDKKVHPDTLPRPYLTGLTFAGKPPAECAKGGVAIGLAAEYGFSGRVELVCDTRIKTKGKSGETWLEGRFSEEQPNDRQICPQDSLISGLSCDGSKCDNLKLRCSKVENYEQKSCFWSDKKMSDVKAGRYGMYYFDEDFAIAGLRCEGRWCDDMYAYLCAKPGRVVVEKPFEQEPTEPVITEEEPVENTDPAQIPATWTVTFESLDPAQSEAFLMRAFGMKPLEPSSQSSALLTYGGESTNVEIVGVDANPDEFSQEIEESDQSRENFSAWMGARTGLWVADLSFYIDRLIGSSVTFIGPVLRNDGVYQLFVKVPAMGYLEFASLTMPDDKHLDMLKDWDDIWKEVDVVGASQVATRGIAYGGDQGLVFDSLTDAGDNDEIVEVMMNANDFVNSITVVYKSGKRFTYGNDQLVGSQDKLTLAEGERLLDGTVCRGKRLNASGEDSSVAVSYVGFSTNYGRHFSLGNHSPNDTESDCIWLEVPEGEHVSGLYGRDDEQGIAKLGFVFKKTPASSALPFD